MSYFHRIPETARRLGRHVHHDPRSRQFSVMDVPDIADTPIKSVNWQVNCGVLDQGNLGACVGYATAENVATGTNFNSLGPNAKAAFSAVKTANTQAIALYSQATQLDDVDGQYPPTDTGSSGLGGAKAAKRFGFVSGYLHAFSLDATLKALQVGPVMVGTNWYQRMFTPSATGEVIPGGSVAGGHEYMAYGYDLATDHVMFQNSWGPDWGIGGRFWMSSSNLGRLLSEQGDVTSLVPLMVAPPTPTPTPVPVPTPPPTPVPTNPDDVKLWADMQAWAKKKGL